MTDQSKPLFAFDEADHLTRIHLKLALEDVGFSVREAGDTVAIVDDGLPTHRPDSGHDRRPGRGRTLSERFRASRRALDHRPGAPVAS